MPVDILVVCHSYSSGCFLLANVPVNSLDNVCAEPKPSDARYLDGLHKTYARHQDFPRTQPKDVVSNRRENLLFTCVNSEQALFYVYIDVKASLCSEGIFCRRVEDITIAATLQHGVGKTARVEPSIFPSKMDHITRASGFSCSRACGLPSLK